MVESKFVILQMILHTLFIEWDFGHYSRHCSLVVLLFITLLLAVLLYTSRWHCSWHCSLAIVKLLFTYTILFMYYGTVHIYGTIHTTIFFLNVHF